MSRALGKVVKHKETKSIKIFTIDDAEDIEAEDNVITLNC